MGVSNAMIQLYEMQVMLRKVVETMAEESANPSLTAYDRCESVKALAAATEAWEKLEERKRIMKGRPLPGTLKHVEYKRRGITKLSDVYDDEIEINGNRVQVLTEGSPDSTSVSS